MNDKYVEEKAMEFLSLLADWGLYASPYKQVAKDFICTIIEDYKPKVDKEWIQTLIYVCDDIEDGQMSIENLHEMLEEAGVKVEKK